LTIERRLAVKVRALPQRGDANRALCALLAKALGLSKSDVSVASGHKSRHKTVQLAGDIAALARRPPNKMALPGSACGLYLFPSQVPGFRFHVSASDTRPYT